MRDSFVFVDARTFGEQRRVHPVLADDALPPSATEGCTRYQYAFSPSAVVLATANPAGIIDLWSAESERALASLPFDDPEGIERRQRAFRSYSRGFFPDPKHRAPLCLEFSPSGRLLAAANLERVVRVRRP
jgi:hypothetical protein